MPAVLHAGSSFGFPGLSDVDDVFQVLQSDGILLVTSGWATIVRNVDDDCLASIIPAAAVLPIRTATFTAKQTRVNAQYLVFPDNHVFTVPTTANSNENESVNSDNSSSDQADHARLGWFLLEMYKSSTTKAVRSISCWLSHLLFTRSIFARDYIMTSVCCFTLFSLLVVVFNVLVGTCGRNSRLRQKRTINADYHFQKWPEKNSVLFYLDSKYSKYTGSKIGGKNIYTFKKFHDFTISPMIVL